MYDDPLAYFITWTTYGTWLPGDDRWWVQTGQGHQPPNPSKRRYAASLMTEPPLILSPGQRELVEQTIRKHCQLRTWELHAVNCRTNHVHVVVTADVAPKAVAQQFKAWRTRRLKEQQDSSGTLHLSTRENWWTEGESRHQLFDAESLQAAIVYVLEGQ